MRRFLLFWVGILLPLWASAQWSITPAVSMMFDDNVNNDYQRTADRVSSLSLTIERDWETERGGLALFYGGGLTYFSKVTDRTFHVHTAGMKLTTVFGAEEQGSLSSGLSYQTRVNREWYTFYDYRNVSFDAAAEYILSDLIVGKAAYTFNSYSFRNLSEFDHTEHVGLIRLRSSLQTRTSLMFEGTIGEKIYSTSNEQDIVSMAGGTGGRGAGSMNGSAPSVTQATALIRVGQGITDATGLSLTTQYLWNLKKESRFLSTDYGAVSDDEVFDDHYGYEGPSWNLMLTQILFEDLSLRVKAGTQRRSYSARQAFDLQGEDLGFTREDFRSFLTLSVRRSFPTLGVSVDLLYDYIRNDSNDPYYHYSNNALSVEFSFLF
jgi:hypothetical protein